MTTPSSQMKISGTRLKTNESMVDSVRILSGERQTLKGY